MRHHAEVRVLYRCDEGAEERERERDREGERARGMAALAIACGE